MASRNGHDGDRLQSGPGRRTGVSGLRSAGAAGSPASLYRPRRFATGRIEMIYGAGSMLVRRDVLERYLDEPFSTSSRSPGEATSSSSRAAAAMDEALPGRMMLKCSKRRPDRAPRWRGCSAVISVRAPTTRGSIGNSQRGSVMRRCGGTRGWGSSPTASVSFPAMLLAGRAAAATSLISVARGAGRIAAEFNLLYEEYRVPDTGGAPALSDPTAAIPAFIVNNSSTQRGRLTVRCRFQTRKHRSMLR